MTSYTDKMTLMVPGANCMLDHSESMYEGVLDRLPRVLRNPENQILFENSLARDPEHPETGALSIEVDGFLDYFRSMLRLRLTPPVENWDLALELVIAEDVDALSQLLDHLGLSAKELSSLVNAKTYRGLTLLHIAALFHRDPDRLRQIGRVLEDAGAVDTADMLGATAEHRANHFKATFREESYQEYFHAMPFLFEKQWVGIDNPADFKAGLKQFYGRGDDVELDHYYHHLVVFWELLGYPETFSASVYNQRKFRAFRNKFDGEVTWPTHFPKMFMAESPLLGAGQLGVYAKTAIEKGTIIGMLSKAAFYQEGAKSMYGYKPPLGDGGSISYYPEKEPHPFMFFNDPCNEPAENAIWVPFFVNGSLVFAVLTIKNIQAGSEVLTSYGPQSWFEKKNIEVQKLDETKHPDFKKNRYSPEVDFADF